MAKRADDLFGDLTDSSEVEVEATGGGDLFGDLAESAPKAKGLPTDLIDNSDVDPAPAYQQPDTLGSAAKKVTQNFPDRMQQAAGGLMQTLEDPLSGVKGPFADMADIAKREAAGESVSWFEKFGNKFDFAKAVVSHFIDQQAGKLTEGTKAEELQNYARAKLAETGREWYADAAREIAANQPQGLGVVDTYLIDTLRAMEDMIPAIAVSAVTKSPAAGGVVMSGQVGGHVYGESRADGMETYKAANRAKFHALAEGLTEMIPLTAMLKKSPAVKKLIDTTLGEGATEFMTSVLQQTYDNAELEGMTLKEAILSVDWGQASYEGLVGLGMGTTMGGTGVVLDKVAGSKDDEGNNEGGDPASFSGEDLFGDIEADAQVENEAQANPERPKASGLPKYEGGIDFEAVDVPKAGPDVSLGATDTNKNQYEGGIDYETTQEASKAPKPLDSTIENDKQAERRLEQDAAVENVSEQLKGVKKPEGLGDPRIMRVEHRQKLQGIADSLKPKKQAKSVDASTDDLLTAIAKAGGISRAEAEAQGIDPESFKEQGKVFGRPLFPREGGLSMDGMAEALVQDGYLSNYDANEMLDKLDEALAGNKVYSTGVDMDAVNTQELAKSHGDGLNAEQIHNALYKALEGKRLGVREARVVSNMLNEISDQRVAENLDSAKEQLAKGRQLLKEARLGLPPVEAYGEELDHDAGDRYQEEIYHPEMDGVTRTLADLSEDAYLASGNEDEVKAILDSSAPDLEIAKRLLNYIGEQHAKNRPSRGKGLPQPAAGTPEAAVRGQQEEQPQASSQDQEVTPASKGLPSDLFGGKTDTQQAIHDKQEARKQKEKNAPDMHEGEGDLFSDKAKQVDIADSESQKAKSDTQKDLPVTDDTQKAKPVSEAPEHQGVGVDDRELGEIVAEFNNAQQSMQEDDEQITHVFDAPKEKDIVRLEKKAGVTSSIVKGKKVYHRDAGWMTVEEAKKHIDEWEANAVKQGKRPGSRSYNGDKVVISLFDLTGKWSLPWEQAGYQVYRFDIQNEEMNEVNGEEINIGDINNHSFELYEEIYGMFEGNDVYAVLAACPCTDFAVSGSKHFAAKDKDGRTVASVILVHQTLNVVEYFKPAVWAIENPVGRIERLGGLPPWRLSFEPFHLGDTYTKKTLLWGRFNGDLPIAPVEPVEGSKMHDKYGGKSIATKNARSATPEGFAYAFFQANNALDNPVMAIANKYDRLDRDLIKQAVDLGIIEKQIDEAVEDHYYMDLDDDAANDAIQELIDANSDEESSPVDDDDFTDEQIDKLNELADQYAELGDKAGEKRIHDRIKQGPHGIKLSNGDTTNFNTDDFIASQTRLVEHARSQKDADGIPPKFQFKGEFKPVTTGEFALKLPVARHIPDDILKVIVDNINARHKAVASEGFKPTTPDAYLIKASKKAQDARREAGHLFVLAEKLGNHFKRINQGQKSAAPARAGGYLRELESIVGDLPKDVTEYLPLERNVVQGWHDQRGKAEKYIGKLINNLGLQEEILKGEDFHVRVKNGSYMDLVIERLPTDDGGQAIYLTHYYKQNGDMIMDTEMVFDVYESGLLRLRETAVNSPLGGEHRARDKTFANMFAKNLNDQGFGDGKLEYSDGRGPDAKPAISETSSLEEAAQEAATHPDNNLPEPTEAQKEAGNYKKGHVTINGLDIAIENPAGSRRRPEWPKLKHHYGYIKGTVGKDKDHIDVFMGEQADHPDWPVYVVDQMNPETRTFDEHKVMMGFASEDEAIRAYRANYAKDWKGLGNVKEFSLADFKDWLENGDTTKPAQSYKPTRTYKVEAVTDGYVIKGANHESIVMSAKPNGPGILNTVPPRVFKTALEAKQYMDKHGMKEDPRPAPMDEKPATRTEKTPEEQAYSRLWKLDAKNLGKLNKNVIVSIAKDAGIPHSRPKKDLINDLLKWRDDKFLSSLEDLPEGLVLDVAEYKTEAGYGRTLVTLSSDSLELQSRTIVEDMARSLGNNETADGVHDRKKNTILGTLNSLSQYFGGTERKRIKAANDTGFSFKNNEDAARFLEYVTGKPAQITDEGAAFQAVEPVAASFKVGDEVQISDNTEDHGGKVGKVVSIEVDEVDGENIYYVEFQLPDGDVDESFYFIHQLGKAPTKKKRSADYGSKNKVVTKSDYEKARELLRKKLGQLNSGVDPEILQAGLSAAVYHIEAGARSFADYAKAMIEDFGDAVRPYLRAWYEGARYYPGFNNEGMTASDEINESAMLAVEDTENDASTDGNTERDSAGADANDALGEGSVQPGSRQSDRGDGRSSAEDGESGVREQGNSGVSDSRATPSREHSDLDLFAQNGEYGTEGSVTRSDDARGRGTDSDSRVSVEREASKSVAEAANESQLDLKTKRKLQDQANSIQVKSADLDNIRKTLPYLMGKQHEDVLKAENRFNAGKHGILFTNGTGTGKTYSGLGIVNRHVRMTGNEDILIVVPTDPKAKDWIEDAANLGLSVNQLKDKKDAGKGIVVTTYANFRDNWELQSRDFSLVVYDESHYLGQHQDRHTETGANVAHRALTGHDYGYWDRAMFRDKDAKALEYKRREFVNAKVNEAVKNNSSLDNQADREDLRKAFGEQFHDEHAEQYARISERVRGIRDSMRENPPVRTKVVFLSASPFAYHFSLEYAEGFLFDFGRPTEGDGSPSYNEGDHAERFYMSNFGYRMRYNKLTAPDKEVNVDLMEREFHEKLKQEGAVSGRQLDVPFDYSRDFIEINSDLGHKVDEGINVLRGYKPDGSYIDKDDTTTPKFELIPQLIGKKFNYTYMSQLMESIKVSQSVARVKEHLKLGRKVVVFHGFQKGVSRHPFDLSDLKLPSAWDDRQQAAMVAQLRSEIELFHKSYPQYAELPLSGMDSVVETLKDVLKDRVRVINGRVSNTEKMNAKKLFNDDNSGVDVLVVQRQAGREGLSLHDITGKMPRALIDLGLPVAPVDAIQTEGRVYRVNLQSDAVIEYPVLNVGFEKYAFATKVAERSRTAENLAMGNTARDLETAFREGYLNASDTAPSTQQGKGGKEADRRVIDDNPYEKAKSYYYGRQKNTKRRDQREGFDYFATPEPVGYKMVEWANIRADDRALEPSAGHGAIARFFPHNSRNVFIEPSSKLADEIQLLSHGEAKALQFEDLAEGSRFDAIVMNPPYGSGGKMAIDHLERAMNHLVDGGRIVALLPDGPAANKRLDALLYGKDGELDVLKDQRKKGLISGGEFDRRARQLNNFYKVADISLPTVTFERAGTTVKTHIVVLDRYDNTQDAIQQQSRYEFDYAQNINELFDEIENFSIPSRNEVTKVDPRGSAAKAPEEVGNNMPIWKTPANQQYKSTKASINSNKNPATVGIIEKEGGWERGTINADIGGGKFDNTIEHMASVHDVDWVVYDPYNRSDDYNDKAVSKIRDGQADTATINNVLNVIKEPEIRNLVLRNAENALKPGGKLYINIYEGEGNAVGRPTMGGETWQEHRRIGTYLGEVQKVFPGAQVKNGLIVAEKSSDSINLESSGDVNPAAFLKEKGINVKATQTKNGNDVWEVSGETFEYKDQIKALGGRWYRPKKAWSFYNGDPTADIAKAIKQATRLSKNNKPASSGLSVSEVKKAVDAVIKDWKEAPQIMTVQKVEELPGHVVDDLLRQEATDVAEGLYDTDTDTIWLIADNIPDAKTAADVVIHEALGHYGLRKLFGRNIEPLLNQVYLAYGNKGLKDIAKLYELDLNKKADRLIAAEEMLAKLAEKNEKPRLVDQVISYIRQWLRKVAPNLKLSDAEIRNIIARAGKAVKNGLRSKNKGAGRAGTGGIRASRSDDNNHGIEVEETANDEEEAKLREEFERLSAANRRGTGKREADFTTVSGGQARPGFLSETRAVSARGEILSLHRGSGLNLVPEHFRKEALGYNTGYAPSGLGVWLTSKQEDANTWGSITETFHLDIRNPKRYDSTNFPNYSTLEEYYAHRENLRKQGHDGVIIDYRIEGGALQFVVFEPDQVVTVKETPKTRLRRRDAAKEAAPEREILKRIKEGRPVDAIFQAMYNPLDAAVKKVLGIDGDQAVTKEAYDRIENLLTNAKIKDDSVMSWMNPLIENARAGLIDRYKLTDEYIERDRTREADEYELMEKGLGILKTLEGKGVDAAEARVLQGILAEGDIAEGDWAQLAEPIRQAIDDLGQEAVILGLLDEATYQKHKGAYLHRVYKKHEADHSLLAGIANKIMGKARKRIVGNQLKRRGMTMQASESALTKMIPDWFGKPLMGQKFHVFDRLQHVGQGTEQFEGFEAGGRKPKVQERVFWPADKPVPAKYKSWENRGEWEVTGKKNGKYEIWRDFSREERQQMGEILDARYTIARTFQVMSHDLATGRFLRDIARNPDWTWQQDGIPDNVGEAGVSWKTYSQYEWVLVPNSNIAGTNKKRWGQLAGKYVRAEIWRDLNQLEAMRKPKVWNTILTQWKLNKTARNPVVHMNNVMSNILFMDMADVRMVDLVRAFHAMRHKSAEYEDAKKHGAFGSGYVHQELHKNVLEPLLDELLAQSYGDKRTMEAALQDLGKAAATMGKVSDIIWKYFKKFDNGMVNVYQLEDEIFRMATYLSRLHQGDSPERAAHTARDQFLNYDIRAPWVNLARATALPFIAYTYRAVPVVAKSIATRPWKLAKYIVIAHMVNALGYALSGGDEDEERKSLRDEAQGDTWLGAPRMIRMPFRDAYGNPVFLDVRRWIPAGDVFDTNQGQGAIPIPAPLQFSGPLMLAAELALNKTAFTGEEIVNHQTDTFGDSAGKIAGWAWKSWMPAAPWVYKSWYWDKIGRSIDGGRDMLGRRYELKYALASSVGVKLTPQDVKLGLSWKFREISATIREHQDDLRQNEMDYNRKLISREVYQENKQHIMSKLKKLEEKAKELQK